MSTPPPPPPTPGPSFFSAGWSTPPALARQRRSVGRRPDGRSEGRRERIPPPRRALRRSGAAPRVAGEPRRGGRRAGVLHGLPRAAPAGARGGLPRRGLLPGARVCIRGGALKGTSLSNHSTLWQKSTYKASPSTTQHRAAPTLPSPLGQRPAQEFGSDAGFPSIRDCSACMPLRAQRSSLGPGAGLNPPMY